MLDSYGDGWNGAEVTISNSDNVALVSGTLDAGLEGLLDVCIAFSGDVVGCTDSSANNYNSAATLDDASSVYPVMGCTDTDAINFNPLATLNDDSCEYTLLITSQLIEFPSGWSLFSTYIESNTPNLIDALSELDTNLIIVKNNAGNAYLPEFNFNNIGDLEPGEGYFLKLTNASNATITGTYATPQVNTITLGQGWNLLGYLRVEPADIAAVLYDMAASENLIIAKDYTGNVYLPEFSFNNIGNIQPGQAYQLKLNDSDALTYLSNEDSYRLSFTEVSNNSPYYLERVVQTDNNMTLVIEDHSWDIIPEEGAEIAAYNKQGNLVGSAKYTIPISVLTLWGEDSLTEVKDGLESEEVSLFEVCSSMQCTSFEVGKWSQGSSAYTANAINIAAGITSNNSSTSSISSERVLLKVLNVLGQEVTQKNAFKGEVLFHVYSDGRVNVIVN